MIDDKLLILTITHTYTNFQFEYLTKKRKYSSVNDNQLFKRAFRNTCQTVCAY